MRPGLVAWFDKHRAPLALAAVLVVLAVGFVSLHHLTQEVRAGDVRAAFHRIAPAQLVAAIGLTAVSYLALTLYDVLALGIIGRPLPWRVAALASFTSYTLSHNLGLGWLTGGSARYRVYTAAGLDGPDVARIIVIAGTTFWMGVVAVTGIALTLHAGPMAVGTLKLSPAVAPLVGLAILAAVAALLAASARGPRNLALFGWSLPIPQPRQAVAQIGIAAVDLAAASAALFVLVPDAALAAWPAFVLAYALAVIAALISHVPGGIGVFEAVLIAALPGDRTALVAALIAYRAIYYLLPLALGAVLLAFHEGRRWRTPAARALSRTRAVAETAAPMVISAATFAGGGILLLSGSLPALPDRLRGLTGFLPLPFIEASHIAASLAGTALLLLAPALYRRLDGAFVATRALLLTGAVFSLAKGFDYEEAIVLSVIAALLQWTRPAFYRRTALTADTLSPRWLAAVAAAVGLSLWIGLFSYRHVAYQDALWWRFAWNGDASRFLRAAFAVAVLLVGAILWRLFSATRTHAAADEADEAVLARAIGASHRTDAMLAMTGDKRFLVSAGRDAFLMYRIKGASWIVMGDPVGPREAWPDLLWRIRGLADAAQGRLLIYQLSADALPIAIELGLHIVKYGEEARVDLRSFSLDGPRLRSIRQADRRAERQGATFEVVAKGAVPAMLPALREVSDAWLAAKGGAEKSFSLGRFDPAYLVRFDCALVRIGGRIVAFANIWAMPNRAELSIDLMRHADPVPSGTMDFLFARLMLWGRAQGYERFSLGLAPLSGIEARHLSPVWAKAASFLFEHGERLYGFKGLRSYKDKFAPTWEPRYIAGPGGVALMRTLLDLQALIGGDPEPRRTPPQG